MIITLSNLLTGLDTTHELNRLSIDLIEKCVPLDSIIYYNFESPTVSGYSGRKALISSTMLDAAWNEWTSLSSERRQHHIDNLIYQLIKDISTLPPKMTLENVHSLAGDDMGVQSIMHEDCTLPNSVVNMLMDVHSQLQDDQLEEYLSICHRLTVNNSARMGSSTNLIQALLHRMDDLFATDKDKNYSGNNASLSKIFLPITFDILAQLVKTSDGCRILGQKKSLSILFHFLDFANNKGDLFSSQIPVAISILACALYQSSSNKHGTKLDWHSNAAIHINFTSNSSETSTDSPTSQITGSSHRDHHENHKKMFKPIPFPENISFVAANEMLRIAKEATKLNIKINALWCHLSHFNATKHQHTDPDVTDNVKLMFETKKWSKKQLDVPHVLIQYLSLLDNDSQLKMLQDHPNIKELNKSMSIDEPELYIEILNYVDIVKKRKLNDKVLNEKLMKSNGGRGKRKKPSPPPPKSNQFKLLLNNRDTQLHEMMLVCLIGLWHYLREEPTPLGSKCTNLALYNVIHDVGIKDIFSMIANSDEIEVQRCAFGMFF
jgi:hypothetical protein